MIITLASVQFAVGLAIGVVIGAGATTMSWLYDAYKEEQAREEERRWE